MQEYSSTRGGTTAGGLIAGSKVKGTDVYNLSGDRLGAVNDLLIEKVSGRTVYALLSFGGFLGMGENYYPLPWSALQYDTERQGYLINLDKRQLENAPNYDPHSAFEWTPDYGREVDLYYDVPNNRM